MNIVSINKEFGDIVFKHSKFERRTKYGDIVLRFGVGFLSQTAVITKEGLTLQLYFGSKEPNWLSKLIIKSLERDLHKHNYFEGQEIKVIYGK